MAPVLITLVLAVGIGLLAGGRLSGLSAMRFRLVPAALAGLLLQFLVPGDLAAGAAVRLLPAARCVRRGQHQDPGFTLDPGRASS